MSPRTSLLLGLLVSTASCTVLEDMGGYSGGAPDTGTSTIDTGTSPVDTGASTETGAEDSGTVDTGTAKDSSVDSTVTDSGVDSTVTDSGADTAIADTGSVDTAVADTGVDTSFDAAGCGLLTNVFGISEIMVRAVNGTMFTADRYEWIEFTNYGSTTLDVSGVTAKVFGGTTEKAAFTFPTGTTLAAGEALVIAIDKTTFMTAVSSSWGTIKVFDFGKSGDILTNGSAFDVRLYAAGCPTPFESATVPARTWSIGVSWAYPVPSTTCPASGRLTGTNALSSSWKESAKDTASTYGTLALPSDAGVQSMYGTPGKSNAGVACL